MTTCAPADGEHPHAPVLTTLRGSKRVLHERPYTVTGVNLAHCSQLTSVVIPDSVTFIRSLENCNQLTSLVIPDSVTRLGYYAAFANCTGLTNVTIGASVSEISRCAFSNCTALTSVAIPDGVMDIGGDAFSGCTGLKTAIIGNGVTNIAGAFRNCSNLTEVTMGNRVERIGGTFCYCRSLTNATIPDSVTDIGSQTFYQCLGLATVSIGNSVTNIGGDAFAGCVRLTSVTIPDSVVQIQYNAFRDCSRLESLFLGSGTHVIGYDAFLHCPALTGVYIHDLAAWSEIEGANDLMSSKPHLYLNGEELSGQLAIPDSAGNIGEWVFHGSRIQGVTIPGSVTNIGDHAFSDSHLKNAVIGNGVTTIGKYAFHSTGLQSVTIGNNVREIRDGAFSWCSLTNVTIPASVKTIGEHAFYYNWDLSNVWFEGPPPDTDSSAFYLVAERAHGHYAAEHAAAWEAAIGEDGMWNGLIMVEGEGPEMQTVKFEARGGTFANGEEEVEGEYEIGGTYDWWPEAELEGYEFDGWWTSAGGGTEVTLGSEVGEETRRTLWAHWTPGQQVVSFNPNGGTCDILAKTVTVGKAYGTLPTPTPYDEWHDFGGWWTAEEGGEQVTATDWVTTAVERTLWAHYPPKTQTVDFDANGGTTSLLTRHCPIGEPYGYLPGATKTGYLFGGWWTEKTGGTPVTEETLVPKALHATLYVHWIPDSQRVTFEANGGTCGTTNGVYTVGETYGELPAATRDGHAFDGWWTEAEEGLPVTTNSTVTRVLDRILYAHWIPSVPTTVWRFYSKAYKGHFFHDFGGGEAELDRHEPELEVRGGGVPGVHERGGGDGGAVPFLFEGVPGAFLHDRRRGGGGGEDESELEVRRHRVLRVFQRSGGDGAGVPVLEQGVPAPLLHD